MTNIKLKNKIHDTVTALDQANHFLRNVFCTSQESLPIMDEDVHKRSRCVCQAGKCKGLCEAAVCSTICEQRQLLAEFECPDGVGRTVPITSLCDGRTDCDDHSDEIHCSGSKQHFRGFVHVITEPYYLLRLRCPRVCQFMTVIMNRDS